MSGWVKIPDNWLESDDIEKLGSDAILLHLSALSYSCRQGSDGRLPTRALRHLWPVEDAASAINVLSSAGQWVEAPDGWTLANWNVHLLANSEVEHRRKVSRESTERYRRHKAGDHSMCERCSVVKGGATSPDWSPTTSLTSLGSHRIASSRSEARETREETEKGRGLGSAGATPTRDPREGRCPHGNLRGLVHPADTGRPRCAECAEIAPHQHGESFAVFLREKQASGMTTDQAGSLLDDLPEAQFDMGCLISRAAYMQFGGKFTQLGGPEDVELDAWCGAYVAMALTGQTDDQEA